MPRRDSARLVCGCFPFPRSSRKGPSGSPGHALPSHPGRFHTAPLTPRASPDHRRAACSAGAAILAAIRTSEGCPQRARVNGRIRMKTCPACSGVGFTSGVSTAGEARKYSRPRGIRHGPARLWTAALSALRPPCRPRPRPARAESREV